MNLQTERISDAYPKISIVVPSYNQDLFLERTLLSIINQNYPNTEIIVIDGGSNDKSVDIIKKYRKHIFYWVSEKDKGQTDALMKGFRLATGELIGWQNSDDVYLPGAFNFFITEYKKHSTKGVYFGNMITIDQYDKQIHKHRYAKFNVNELLYSGWNITNQSCLFAKIVIDSINVDTGFQYAMDAALFLEIAHKGFPFYHVKEYLGCLRMHGATKTATIANDSGWKEWIKLREKYNVYMDPNVDWSKQYVFRKFLFKLNKVIYYLIS